MNTWAADAVISVYIHINNVVCLQNTVEPCYLEHHCVEFRVVSKSCLMSLLLSFVGLLCVDFFPCRSVYYVEVISQAESAVNPLCLRNFSPQLVDV